MLQVTQGICFKAGKQHAIGWTECSKTNYQSLEKKKDRLTFLVDFKRGRWWNGMEWMDGLSGPIAAIIILTIGKATVFCTAKGNFRWSFEWDKLEGILYCTFFCCPAT